MSPRQRRGEAVREGRRGLTAADSHRVEVRVFNGPWLTADVCGASEARAREAAEARVSETWAHTDLNGDLVQLRRYSGVRLLCGARVVQQWTFGVAQLDGDEAAAGMEAR